MFFLVVKYVYDTLLAESLKWGSSISGLYTEEQFQCSNNFPVKISIKTAVYALNTYWCFMFKSVRTYYEKLISKIMMLTLKKLSNRLTRLPCKWDFILEYAVIQLFLNVGDLV